jgi:hypothetical protein
MQRVDPVGRPTRRRVRPTIPVRLRLAGAQDELSRRVRRLGVLVAQADSGAPPQSRSINEGQVKVFNLDFLTRAVLRTSSWVTAWTRPR